MGALALALAAAWLSGAPALGAPPPASEAGATAEGRSSQGTAGLDPAPTGTIMGPAPESRALILENQRLRTVRELAAISSSIELGTETVRDLDAEIAALSRDRDRLREAMVTAAARQKDLSRALSDTGQRIAGLSQEEGSIKASLVERRSLLAEVLAALERMGRTPPPALLVKPQDALGSVRSAILLGSVVPSIRDETRRLLADLERLSTVRASIVAEKERFATDLRAEREEEARLGRLFLEKERLEATNRDRRASEAARASELAAKAGDLKELIAALEADAAKARASEEEAARQAALREAEAARAAALAAQAERTRLAALAEAEAARLKAEREAQTRSAGTAATPPADIESPKPQEPQIAALEPAPPAAPAYDVASLRRDLKRLEPAAAFSTMKGRLSGPVGGRQIAGFGDRDDIGRLSTGATFAARAGDVVTAPSDANVLYSGPFRSYGQLLILDAGDGYHVVLAGMNRIDVEVGQFVSAGEPVAVMGDRRLASVAGADFDASEPALYVEFRKDGKPVDPSPWWTKGPSGRTRNDP
ncbi:peptidoglycan DD-metalloendopeptidase family protein [Aurantimonas sp. Leaf443]|uniref:murein hydrolase activator EnvC family protein n=1 Tax=Aurantimonas sp. Leaf443 TaxID=1736378 RepID=UPI0006FC03DF|nr:peptidoglycan DD-metalloendopeptidase family protein [Aurantimonas sp. Leaf443]KQT87506.1 hypothetical protein ASG48_17090 [Aurantimonas sp. Leaf443]